MKKKNLRMVTVLDNGGETYDRYTIINRETGDVFGASHNPFHPNGVGLFNHNIADEYWNVAYGYSWRKHCDVKKCIKFAVSRYLTNKTGIDKKIKLSQLPEDVIKFIHQSVSEIMDEIINLEINGGIDWKFGVITRYVERTGEDEYQIHDTSSGWVTTTVNRNTLELLYKGEKSLLELDWE